MPDGESSLVARLLGGSMAAVLRRLGLRTSTDTEEEIQALLKEGIESGLFGAAEQEMVTRVFRLGDHRANELMTPMNEVVWLDVTDPPEEMKRKITESPHSRFPVCEGSIDNILGIVQVKDLLIHSFTGQPFGIKGLLKMPLFIYEGTPVLATLEMFKKSGMHVAVVLDEYGSVRGLLTLNDILEAIVGDLPVGQEPEESRAIEQEDGSWLLDGRLTIDELQSLVGDSLLPEGDYQTLAGLIITQLGRLPAVGDRYESGRHCFEVLEMEGQRLHKVRLTRSPERAAGRESARRRGRAARGGNVEEIQQTVRQSAQRKRDRPGKGRRPLEE
jgi:putative hemolysin